MPPGLFNSSGNILSHATSFCCDESEQSDSERTARHTHGYVTTGSNWESSLMESTVIRAIIISSATPTEQGLRTRAMQELGVIALTLISWIVPICLMFILTITVIILYKKRYVNGLLIGAGLTGIIYASVEGSSNSPPPLLITIIMGYFLLHITYCYTVITTLRVGELFVTVASFLAALMLLLLSLTTELAGAWHGATGLAGIWSFFPSQLVLFFLSALIVKQWRSYTGRDREPNLVPLLPMHHVSNATSTSRGDGTQDPRRRTAADTNATF